MRKSFGQPIDWALHQYQHQHKMLRQSIFGILRYICKLLLLQQQRGHDTTKCVARAKPKRKEKKRKAEEEKKLALMSSKARNANQH